MEGFKQKHVNSNAPGFNKDPLESEMSELSYDYDSLLKKIEENKGRIKEEKPGERIRDEKVLNTLIDRGVRWCARNYYRIWLASFQIIRKKISKSQQLSKDEVAILKTMVAVMSPHKINELGVRNYTMDPIEIYQYNLKKINENNRNW
jgi:hypothetical protein